MADAEELYLPNYRPGLRYTDELDPFHEAAEALGELVDTTLGVRRRLTFLRSRGQVALVDADLHAIDMASGMADIADQAVELWLEEGRTMLGSDFIDHPSSMQSFEYASGTIAEGESLIEVGWHQDGFLGVRGKLLKVMGWSNIVPTRIAHGRGNAEQAHAFRRAVDQDRQLVRALKDMGMAIDNISDARQKFIQNGLEEGWLHEDGPQPNELYSMDGETVHSAVANPSPLIVTRAHVRMLAVNMDQVRAARAA